jgi:endonuclease/exonuclease/phosphatase family metal-dependent hydrolase
MLRIFLGLILAILFAVAAPAAEPVQIKILSFNIWYGGEQVNFNKVIEAIQKANADIVGLQEPDGNTLRIAALAGYPYADVRRHIISRFPLFDSGVGERTEETNPPYSIAGVDSNAVHAWALVAPGKVIAVANTHLTSDPYGPELVRDGKTIEEVLQNETDTRLPEAQALADGLSGVAKSGAPVFLTGDFNSPSYLDWTEAVMKMRPAVKFPVEWPVSKLMTDSGFTDSYRAAHPDPVKNPGLTWTAGYPNPYVRETETHDRIDFIWAANAQTVSSEIMGEKDNPEVAIAVVPWPSDHRAVVSTFTVTPMDAPALIAVEPAPVVSGQTFIIRVNSLAHANWSAVVVPRGGDPAKDGVTGIKDVAPGDRPSIKLSTMGLDPGRYDAVMLDGEGKEAARNRFSIVSADAKATISVTQAAVKTGGDIAVSWSGAPGFRFDWVGVYRKNEPSVYNYLGFVYTGAKHEGELTIPASSLYEELAPGDYELRLMHDDHYATLAIAPFTVIKP